MVQCSALEYSNQLTTQCKIPHPTWGLGGLKHYTELATSPVIDRDHEIAYSQGGYSTFH
jgi:hypothetical protein